MLPKDKESTNIGSVNIRKAFLACGFGAAEEEIRNSKPEGNPKSKSNSKTQTMRLFEFAFSYFLRISKLGLRICSLRMARLARIEFHFFGRNALTKFSFVVRNGPSIRSMQ